MGQEIRCRVTSGGKSGEGRARFETDELIFRGDFTVRIPLSRITAVRVTGDTLSVTSKGQESQFHLGAAAATWAERIRNPKTLVDKLGIRASHRVAFAGVSDAAFREQLERAGASVAAGARGTNYDVIFLRADRRSDLRKLAPLRKRLQPAGAIWVLRPKGIAAITEGDVMRGGKDAGLVDVKVVRFSDTHTAEKFVIPLAKR
jgi:hypothetical protein